MIKILIVEDDQAILDSLKHALELKEYQVVLAMNPKEALCLMDDTIDLILMDIQLPGGNGITLCQKIREIYETPLLFLTCRNDEETLVEALNAGGDDYIVKPFGIQELYARINSALRRSPMSKDVVFTHDLKIDTTSYKVYKEKELLDLSLIGYTILITFIEAKGKVVTREKLLEIIESKTNHFVEDNTLSVHIKRLRESLGQNNEQQYIETLRGVGYRWNM